MTLPAPDYQLPWTCDHCGYVGDTGPVHEHPRAARGQLCPHQAIGGERYYSEAAAQAMYQELLRFFKDSST